MSALVWQSPRSSASPTPGMVPHGRHQVPFGHNTHHHGGDSSAFGSGSGGTGGFGFGFGAPAASTSSSSGFGFGSSAFWNSNNNAGLKSPSSAAGPSMLMSSPSAAGTSNNRRRRRRSDSPEEMREQLNDDQEDEGQGPSSFAGKRMRREVRPMKSMGNLLGSNQGQGQGTPGTPAGQSSSGNEVDVGKALAGLSKPALLTVLTSLLTQQPGLKPLVFSLLPAPSLETFASTLHSLEKRVTDSLPVGSNLRDEYIWTRIRAPLEEYISEARLALGQFCPPSSSNANDDSQQPAIIFSFLYTLTLSVRKLESLLPRAPVPFASASLAFPSTQASVNNPSTLNPRDPLISFLPPLYNQWHHLITKLSTLVNQNGRVLGADMVRGWFRNLDSLVNLDGFGQGAFGGSFVNGDANSVGKRASEAVRERFVKELGWLIGIRVVAPAVSMAGAVPTASTTGNMDSRMTMMDDGEDSDEEL